MSAPARSQGKAPPHIRLFLDLVCLSVRMNSRTATAFYRMGLGRVEAFILLYVSQTVPQDCTMRHLRHTLQLNNASLAKAVNGLIRKGYLYRQEITLGRTAKQLTLTDLGRALLPTLYQGIEYVLPNQKTAQGDGALWELLLKGLLALTEAHTLRRSAAA